MRRDHAVIAPETHVAGPVPGWRETHHVQVVGPNIGARFGLAIVRMDAGGVAGQPRPGVGRFLYVLEGGLRLDIAGDRHGLGVGGYAYIPPDTDHGLHADEPARACVIDKPYVPTPRAARGVLIVGDRRDRPADPMLGDPALRVRSLLPEEPALDLAVNVMTFDPGAALPSVESHVMEHGLLVLEGSLVYRLAESWYPVTAGDAIWMAPFCPQWCCAYGPGPAEYLIYKDWNRDVVA